MRVLAITLALVASTLATPAASAAPPDYGLPGSYPVAYSDVTAVAGGRSVPARVHYPATAAGVNQPVATGRFPAIAFGHGFFQATSKYTSTNTHLASWGFVVVVPTTQGGLSPSHSAFADDLNTGLTWLVAQDGTAGSRFQNHVTTTALGASGHSMGGGAAVLAAARNPKITAISTYAAAETNPSAKAAAATLKAPAQFLAGSQDTITPVGEHQQPMFAAKAPSKQLRTVTGGFHCGFMDTSGLFCDNGSVTRAAQLVAAKRVLTSWFRHYLAGDAAARDFVWGQPARTDAAVTFEGTE
ncbi:dienelactone hydrolase family protein [Lentzea sp. NBC_00516]|uniref:poly(ethylene terephthalate) hydrolase family protein n=1 Tax=Lentzea sp. NBC_00516 TaxID=2903582 RepID=UPI002E7FF6BA|nr:dienelactone hydrolase family protein [Lentzea sp. NBC_00516]WUD26565.1 dienelactone hydrolase family protein [Lentzea sp. NBC_00516]